MEYQLFHKDNYTLFCINLTDLKVFMRFKIISVINENILEKSMGLNIYS